MSNIEKVRTFIVENFLFGDDSSLKNDTSFLQERIVDSTGILEIIAFLEEQFAIKIEDDELLPENLDSLDNIDVFLKRKLGTT
ncbi:MAG TPA: acyl carrier protein [Smithellaceae bacterium]|nr:acyl carrier protein [Smithellaceae bacterium]